MLTRTVRLLIPMKREKLYKIPDDEVVLEADSITNFLGEVADNPVFIESKLNEQERNSLEHDLTLD